MSLHNKMASIVEHPAPIFVMFADSPGGTESDSDVPDLMDGDDDEDTDASEDERMLENHPVPNVVRAEAQALGKPAPTLHVTPTAAATGAPASAASATCSDGPGEAPSRKQPVATSSAGNRKKGRKAAKGRHNGDSMHGVIHGRGDEHEKEGNERENATCVSFSRPAAESKPAPAAAPTQADKAQAAEVHHVQPAQAQLTIAPKPQVEADAQQGTARPSMLSPSNAAAGSPHAHLDEQSSSSCSDDDYPDLLPDVLEDNDDANDRESADRTDKEAEGEKQPKGAVMISDAAAALEPAPMAKPLAPASLPKPKPTAEQQRALREREAAAKAEAARREEERALKDTVEAIRRREEKEAARREQGKKRKEEERARKAAERAEREQREREARETAEFLRDQETKRVTAQQEAERHERSRELRARFDECAPPAPPAPPAGAGTRARVPCRAWPLVRDPAAAQATPRARHSSPAPPPPPPPRPPPPRPSPTQSLCGPANSASHV